MVGDFNLPKITWIHDNERPGSLICTDESGLSPCEIKFLRLIETFGFSQMNGILNSKGVYLDLLLTTSCKDFRIFESSAEENLDRVTQHHKPYCIEYFDFYTEKPVNSVKKVPIMRMAR